MLPTNSSTKKTFKIIYVDDAQNHAEQMQDGMKELYGLLQTARCEYSTYKEQKLVVEKHFPEKLTSAKELFARDFAGFKTTLNETIRAYKQFHEDFKIQLGLLGNDHSFIKELAEFEKHINQLKNYYYKDKDLYADVKLPDHNPDIVKVPEKNSTEEHTPSVNANINGPKK